MNNIFLYFTKSKIRWINIPIILSIFLFTCIIILMRFQIHLSNLWFFKHIYTRINRLFCTILIFLSLQSKFKILIFSWLWEIIVSINSLSQRLSKFYLSKYLLLQWFILRFIKIIYKFIYTLNLSCFHYIINSLWFFCRYSICIILWG